MQRQGLQVSINQLKSLIKRLEADEKEVNEVIKPDKIKRDKYWQVNIINRSDASDTWELER